jgi:hypothetical protein
MSYPAICTCLRETMGEPLGKAYVALRKDQYEALMAAAKVFAGYARHGCWGDDAHCALAALRAAGIQIEGEGK